MMQANRRIQALFAVALATILGACGMPQPKATPSASVLPTPAATVAAPTPPSETHTEALLSPTATSTPLPSPSPTPAAEWQRYYLFRYYHGANKGKTGVLSANGELVFPQEYSWVMPVTDDDKALSEALRPDALIYLCRETGNVLRTEIGHYEGETYYEDRLEGEAAFATADGTILTEYAYSDVLWPRFLAPDLIAAAAKGDKEIRILHYPSLETRFSLSSDSKFTMTPSLFDDGRTLAVFEETKTTLYDMQSIRDGSPRANAALLGRVGIYRSEADQPFLVLDGSESGTGCGAVDSTGDWMIPPEYGYIYLSGDKLILTKPDVNNAPARSGVYDMTAKKLIVPFRDWTITWCDDEVFCVTEIEEGRSVSYLCDTVTLEPISAQYAWITEPAKGIDYMTAQALDQSVGVLLNRKGMEVPLSAPDGTQLEPTGMIDNRFLNCILPNDTSTYGLFDVESGELIVPTGTYTLIATTPETLSANAYNAMNHRFFTAKTNEGYSPSRYALLDERGEVLIDDLNEIYFCDGERLFADRGFTSGMMDMEGNWIWKTSFFDMLDD